MSLDQTQNFVRVDVSGTHTSTDTTISLASGEASNVPDPANGEYNLVWWDDTTYNAPDTDPEVEIVRVTGRDTVNDNITVQRGQENTSAVAHDTSSVNYRMILASTAKMFADVDAALNRGLVAHESNVSLSNEESLTLARFTVPTGKKVEILAGSVATDAGNHVAGMELELFNHTDGTTEHVIANNTVQQGNPIYEGSGGDDVEFRLVNASGTNQIMNGQVAFGVVNQ